MQSMMLAAYMTAALWVSQTPAIENKAFPRLGPDAADGLEQLGLFRRHRHRGTDQSQRRLHGRAAGRARLAVHRRGHPVVRAPVARLGLRPQSQARAGRVRPLVAGRAKFPSSADGKGFKPLADYVHAKGLKFGIHLMRGIPREAVKRDCRILGTDVTAAAIANTASTCPWNPDMYGVDMSKPGAQAYYDSVFKLFAEWDVDYVKVDDLSRPYHDHEARDRGHPQGHRRLRPADRAEHLARRHAARSRGPRRDPRQPLAAHGRFLGQLAALEQEFEICTAGRPTSARATGRTPTCSRWGPSTSGRR